MRPLSNGHGAGWRRGLPDPVNDWKLSRRLGALPRKTPESPALNHRYFPRIRDQGQIGSCTGFGLRNCLAYKLRERLGDKLEGEWGQQWDLSPLAMYWLGRREEGDEYVSQDIGAIIRLVVVAARKHGIPTEEAWPYDPAKFKRRPSAKALETGRWHQAAPGSYRCDEDGNRERTVDRILQALEAGLPVTYGFACYANLGEADATGVIPEPRGRQDGGHCVTAYWADTRARILWGPNSWGYGWGPDGYIGLPFAYFLDGLADDVWAVDLEEAA
jgi:hypothetical protein